MTKKRSAPSPQNPLAKLQKFAKRAEDESDFIYDLAEDPPVKDPRTVKAASDAKEGNTRRPKMTNAEKSAESARVAKEHGAEREEAELDGVQRKLARPKG